MPTLDENEVAVLSELKSADPALYRKLRAEALRASSKLHPDVVIPEVDLENRLDAIQTASDTKLAKLEADLEAEREARAKAEAVVAAREQHGLAPDDLPKVEKFMAENKIDDFDAGVRFMRLQEAEAAKAAGPATNGLMQLPANFSDALKDRRGARRKNLFGALDDLRKNARRNAIFATN